MFDIIVALVAVTADGFCMMGDGVPHRKMGAGEDADEIASDLMFQATGLKHGQWILIRQISFLSAGIDGCPTVLYSVTLPERTDIHHFSECQWASIDAIESESIRSMIEISINYHRVNQ